MRAILMFHSCEGQSHKTVSTDHNFWRERRAETDSNRGPSAYQPSALPLGQTGSQSSSGAHRQIYAHSYKPSPAFPRYQLTNSNGQPGKIGEGKGEGGLIFSSIADVLAVCGLKLWTQLSQQGSGRKPEILTKLSLPPRINYRIPNWNTEEQRTRENTQKKKVLALSCSQLQNSINTWGEWKE